MDFFQYIKVLTILLFLPIASQAQIVTGNSNGEKVSKPKKVKRVVEKKPIIENPNTIFYLSGGFGTAYRNLKVNKGLFGKPLGERVYELNIFVPNFSLGVKSRLRQNFYLDLGVSSALSGENYSYELADSTYSYKSTYSYFAIPIKIQYISGDKWKLIAGIGLQPQILVGYKQEITWNDRNGKSGEKTVKDKDDLNFFSISALANIGVSWQLKKNTSIFLLPEFRYDLSNTYLKQAPYNRKGFFIGAQIGLSIAVN